MSLHASSSPTQVSDTLGSVAPGEQTEAWVRLAVAMIVPVLLLLVGISLTR